MTLLAIISLFEFLFLTKEIYDGVLFLIQIKIIELLKNDE